MTPLIDVLLVLLTIFMIITPTASTGLYALVPQPPSASPAPPKDDLVITVLGNQTVRLNQEPVALAYLGERLTGIFKNAPMHVVFLRGDGALYFQQVAEVIDVVKGAGLEIGLMTQ